MKSDKQKTVPSRVFKTQLGTPNLYYYSGKAIGGSGVASGVSFALLLNSLLIETGAKKPKKENSRIVSFVFGVILLAPALMMLTL